MLRIPAWTKALNLESTQSSPLSIGPARTRVHFRVFAVVVAMLRDRIYVPQEAICANTSEPEQDRAL